MRKNVLDTSAPMRIMGPMSDESQAMRVNVSLDHEAMEALVVVMAGMPSRDASGKPVTIGPADALRHALHETAKRLNNRKGK